MLLFDCAAALPNEQLPIMEVDGVVIPQSLAQLRYVGKIAGLYPTDPIQAALADAAADALTDITFPMRAAYNEQDGEKKVRFYLIDGQYVSSVEPQLIFKDAHSRSSRAPHTYSCWTKSNKWLILPSINQLCFGGSSLSCPPLV